MKKSLVEKHIGTLQHFIEEGGWGLRVISDEKAAKEQYLSRSEANELILETDGFLVRKGECLTKGIAKPSARLLANYWEYRFKEEQQESDRLYKIIKAADLEA